MEESQRRSVQATQMLDAALDLHRHRSANPGDDFVRVGLRNPRYHLALPPWNLTVHPLLLLRALKQPQWLLHRTLLQNVPRCQLAGMHPPKLNVVPVLHIRYRVDNQLRQSVRAILGGCALFHSYGIALCLLSIVHSECMAGSFHRFQKDSDQEPWQSQQAIKRHPALAMVPKNETTSASGRNIAFRVCVILMTVLI